MSEHSWLQQTRALNRSVTPQRDLWPDIAEAIATAPAAGKGRKRWPFAVAAALALSVAGFTAWTLQEVPSESSPSLPKTAQASRWQPQDPRLIAAAADLDVARATLTHALEVTPDAAYLHRLLARTAQTRNRLQKLEHSVLGTSVHQPSAG